MASAVAQIAMRALETERAINYHCIPRRIMVGMGQTLDDFDIEWRNAAPLTDAGNRETIEQLKKHGLLPTNAEEATDMTTNIDRKDFVAKPVSVRADSLAARHLGSLVTIQTSGNAEVTDILRAVYADTNQQQILVGLENLRRDWQGPNADFIINPRSVVLVRKPKPVTKAAPKK